MTQKIDVRAVHALDDLRAALVRFRAEAEAALREMEAAIRRVEQYLGEREVYWKRQVTRWEAEHKKALAALAACRSRAYRDPKTGRTYVPPCTQEQEWVMRTRVEMARAQDALRTVREWRKVVERAVEEYRRQARSLAAHLEENVPKATASLKSSARILRSYTSISLPSPTATPVLGMHSPTQTGVVLTSLALVGIGAVAMSGLLSLARHLSRATEQSVSPEEGISVEQVSSGLSPEKKEEVFSLENGEVVVIVGENLEIDEGYISTHVRGWHLEQEPRVVAVVDVTRGKVRVFGRDEMGWKPVGEGRSVEEAWTEALGRPAHWSGPGGVERDPGPEMQEGGVSGVERR